MRVLGICFGATTLQSVVLCTDDNQKKVESSFRIPHEGNPKQVFLNLLQDSLSKEKIDRIVITGRHFRENVRLTSIAEVEAIEYAVKETYSNESFPNFIISAGGETQLVYKLDQSGNIIAVYSGNKCASGTGEFFLQQIRRMDIYLRRSG